MRQMDLQLIATALSDPTRFRAFELICSCETITSQALAEILGYLRRRFLITCTNFVSHL
jgi:hypothetical protein